MTLRDRFRRRREQGKPELRPILKFRIQRHLAEMHRYQDQMYEAIQEILQEAKHTGLSAEDRRWLKQEQGRLCVALCCANVEMTKELPAHKAVMLADLLKAMHCRHGKKEAAVLLEEKAAREELYRLTGVCGNAHAAYWDRLIAAAQSCGKEELIAQVFGAYADLSVAIFSFLNHRYRKASIAPLEHSKGISYQWFTEFRAGEIRKQLLAEIA